MEIWVDEKEKSQFDGYRFADYRTLFTVVECCQEHNVRVEIKSDEEGLIAYVYKGADSKFMEQCIREAEEDRDEH